MEADRLKWNGKYADAAEPGQPAAIVADHFHLAPSGRALDLACGLGRHALFLADQGWEVDALDISNTALARLNHPQIRTIPQDLDHWTAPEQHYTLVLDLYFLDRNLYPQIRKTLQPGGILIMETALKASTHIGNPNFKLNPGELLDVFGDWDILFHKETDQLGSLVARRP